MIFYSDINSQDPLIDDKIFDLESVYQSIENILSTRKGERLFLPEFGCDLEQFLFDLDSPGFDMQLFDEIYASLVKYEPRIDVDLGESFVRADGDEHLAELVLVFSITGKTFDKYVYQTDLTNIQKERYYEL